MILIIDNYDSFTWNLVDYIKRQGEDVEMVRNDFDPLKLQLEKYRGIVLSPGPGKPEDSGNLMEYLKVLAPNKPILGICLGHQAIGLHFGAYLQKANRPMHGKISEVNCLTTSPLFNEIPEKFKVVRYHSLILTELPEFVRIIAETDGQVMAIEHKYLPIYGLQFHPEAYLTAFGEKIIANWIKICQKFGVE